MYRDEATQSQSWMCNKTERVNRRLKDASKQRDDREKREREDEIDEKIVSEAGVVQTVGKRSRKRARTQKYGR